jgi:hypothetical protein
MSIREALILVVGGKRHAINVWQGNKNIYWDGHNFVVLVDFDTEYKFEEVEEAVDYFLEITKDDRIIPRG